MSERINSIWRLDSLPTSSVSNARSRVISCEVFTTESFGRPVALADSNTLPGASAQRRLLVKGTHTTVLIRLLLRASPWTTNTHGLGRLPFDVFECTSRGARNGWV